MWLASLSAVAGQATLHVTMRVAVMGAAMESAVQNRPGTGPRRRMSCAGVFRKWACERSRR